MQLRRFLLSLVALALIVGGSTAWGAGIFPGFPYPTTDMTGNESIPADTNLPSGVNPQTQIVTPGDIARYARLTAYGGSLGNMLIGGDFGVNPWARNADNIGAAVFNGQTASYTADRFWVTVTASGQVSRQTGAASLVSGTTAALRFGRQNASTAVGNMCIGQVLETADSLKAQGRSVTLSFYARAGATLSTVSSRVSVLIRTGTGTNQSAVLFSGGNWTGSANAASTTTNLTSAWTRYQTTAALASGTNQLGVQICAANGERETTAGATDFVELALVQLEVGTRASAFQFRPQALETFLAQRYFTAINEEVSGVWLADGLAISGTVCRMSLVLPQAMRAAPSVLVSIGTWGVVTSRGSYQRLTTLASGVGTSTPLRVQLVATSSGADSETLVGTCPLQSEAQGGGFIRLNSEL